MSAITVAGPTPPIERRWAGFDRRSIAPGAIAIVIALLLAVVLPAIDRAIEYDRETRAGDVIDLGSGVTVVPPAEWSFLNGLLVTDQTLSGSTASSHLGAKVENAGATVSITTGPFAGTSDELLQQAIRINTAYIEIEDGRATSDPTPIETSAGVAGTTLSFAGANVEGVIGTFALNGTGVQFVVYGPPGAVINHRDAILTMVESLSFESTGGGQ